MRLFTFRCPSCGIDDDRFCDYSQKDDQICGECGEKMDKIMNGGGIVGPTDTRPVKLSGESLTTASAVSRWENSNPGLQPMSKNDTRVKEMVRRNKHKMERKAEALGYKSERHRRDEVRKRGGLAPKVK